jgi:hypothetical protein
VGLTTSTVKNKLVTNMFKKPRTWTDSFDKRIKRKIMGLRSVIRMIKSSRMRWAVHVARMGGDAECM